MRNMAEGLEAVNARNRELVGLLRARKEADERCGSQNRTWGTPK